jgi:uncharacterized protein (TIGR00251 family)
MRLRSLASILGLDGAAVIHAAGDGVIIDVRVIPRAGTSGIVGTRDGALLVRLNAPPVDGAANAELVEVLARALGLPKRAICLVSGERSRRKRVQVQGITVETGRAKLFRDATGSGTE